MINYEQVGLTLKFKPIVFPNQDVQVAMEIESKDVVAGGTDSNPVFSERTIKGTARVQNNRTLLLASVAQDVESRGKSGLPLLGLIPILAGCFQRRLAIIARLISSSRSRQRSSAHLIFFPTI